jgi:DEAD/DEAH box helicase domain-containing protein
VEGTNSDLAFTFAGRVFRLNNRRGLLFEGAIGDASLSGGRHRLSHQWIDSRFHNQDDGVYFQQKDSTECIAVAAPKTTDLLRVRPASVPAGLSLDPLTYGGGVKAAFYSAAFIIRAVCAEQLDIDPEELDISNVRRVSLNDESKVGEIVINDHLANGAGFSNWIAQNWKAILLSLANPSSKSFLGSLLSHEHVSNCDSSCYDCLRQYRNMSYHGLLDWRLGVCLLRILSSGDWQCGVNGDFSSPELFGWQHFAGRSRDAFCNSFDCSARQFGPLPGFEVGSRRVIVVHPLWNTQAPSGALAEAIASVSADTKLQYIDTFNLHRRMSWSYQSLARVV